MLGSTQHRGASSLATLHLSHLTAFHHTMAATILNRNCHHTMGNSHTRASTEAGTTCPLHTPCHRIHTTPHHRTFRHTCIISHLTSGSSISSLHLNSSTCGRRHLTERVGARARTVTMPVTGTPRDTAPLCLLHTPDLPLPAPDCKCTTEVLLRQELVTLLRPRITLWLNSHSTTHSLHMPWACTIPQRTSTSSTRGVLHPCIRGTPVAFHSPTSPQHRTFQTGRCRPR